MNAKVILTLLTLGATVVASGATGRTSTAAGLTACSAARVHYTPYPGGAPGLGRLPWVRADSAGLGLVGLLWYWPGEWRDQGIDRALMYPGGHAPAGSPTTKVLWAFLSPKAKRLARGSLIVQGQRLDGQPGKTWQQFGPIGYDGQNGAPSYASIIVLPSEGCWKLRLSAGAAHANIVFQAATAP
jgi:hypothetical protein